MSTLHCLALTAALAVIPMPAIAQQGASVSADDIALARQASEDVAAARRSARNQLARDAAKNTSMSPGEMYAKVIRPRLAAARTCGDRLEAMQAFVNFARQHELLTSGSATAALNRRIDVPEVGEVLAGRYTEDTFNRCMDESYRRCVVEEEPAEVFQMIRWTLAWETQRVLLGGGTRESIDPTAELDPRITACRGPLYRVRLSYDQQDGAGYTRDRFEGWIGRGVSADIHRHMESRGPGAKCPDGDCGDWCYVTMVGDGEGRIEPRVWDHEFFVAARKGAYTVRTTENSCPANASPDLQEPTVTRTLEFTPTELITPLVGGAPDIDQVSVDADAIAAIDPWPKIFIGNGPFELTEFDKPVGTVEVLETCDGREMYGRGSAACKRLWQHLLPQLAAAHAVRRKP